MVGWVLLLSVLLIEASKTGVGDDVLVEATARIVACDSDEGTGSADH
jgi:hypothetical protein